MGKKNKTQEAPPSKKKHQGAKSSATSNSNSHKNTIISSSKIDELFQTKKQKKQEQQQEEEEEQHRSASRQQTKDFFGSGGNKNVKKVNLKGDRADLDNIQSKDEWLDDGLGGIFDREGFTGRRDTGGERVFKAHLMNKKGFGQTKLCPFDCDCCYI